jgi:SAM-dependent methyltransferase
MNTDYIKENWKNEIVDVEASKRLWGLFSQMQKPLEAPSPENNLSLRIVCDNQMIDHRSNVLDLGCGSGRFSTYFAKQCSHVVGLDLSEEMIDACKKAATKEGLTNTEFIIEDWHEVDLSDHNWTDSFDLVFAHMTPAIQSVKTLSMMNEVSSHWCFMAKPAHREDRVTNYLLNALGISSIRRPDNLDTVYAFCWLCLNGYFPKTDYKKDHWERTFTTEEAAAYYTEWICMRYHLTDEQKAAILPALEKIAVDGNIIEKSEVVIAILYWHV